MEGLPIDAVAEQASDEIGLIHAIPGRLRFRVGGLRRRPDRAAALARRLQALPDVRESSVSALTGSVTLRCPPGLPADALQRRISAAWRETLDPPPRSLGAAAAAEDSADAPHAPANEDARTWHTLSVADVVAALGTDGASGLTPEEARSRLQRHGQNRLAEPRRASRLAIAGRQFANLPTGLLAGSAVVSLATGGVLDAAVTLAVVLANAGLGFVTESGAEEAIARMTARRPYRVPVRRGGAEIEIDSLEVVPGDLLSLRPDVLVAADARILTADRLTANEALLTGESEAQPKSAAALADPRLPLADHDNMVHHGSFIVTGRGSAAVTATGQATELGRIEAMASTAATPETPLSRDLGRLGRQLVLLSLTVCGVVFVAGFLRGHGLLQMLKSSVALAVAAVPEGLPTIATTTLAIGLRQMRGHGVAIRRLQAVEGLGAMQVLCLDKTGTITENRMQAAAFAVGGEAASEHQPDAREMDATAPGRRLLEAAALCSEAEPPGAGGGPRGSATECALLEAALAAGLDVTALRHCWPTRDVRYRDETHRYMVTRHEGDSGVPRTAMKGDPRQVLELCASLALPAGSEPLDEAARGRIAAEIDAMSGRGFRVLGFADGDGDRFDWLGCIGLKDPVRPEAREVIAALHRAGVRPLMITGDQAATAEAVAHEIGLSGNEPLNVLDARAIDRMDAEVLVGLARRTHVFARVPPSRKLDIVRALQRSGLVVGMTGDGFNDAPALKAADIAIAVGGGGATAARDVADAIIENGDLRGIVEGVEQGRTIASNIRKAVHFMISTNLSEILVVLAETLNPGDQLESPMEMFWLNLVTDVLPGLGLALEPPEREVMSLPPRDPKEPILTMRELRHAGLESFVLSGGTMLAHFYGLSRYGPGPHTRTLTLTSLVTAQLLHAFACRFDRFVPLGGRALFGNRTLNRAVGASFALQTLPLFFPPVRRLLGIAPARPMDFAIAALAGAGAFLVNETLLATWSRRGDTGWAARLPGQRGIGMQ
ncbi:cation-translocating P-type ATPase [Minwuia thermotolerans]|uniref:Cation-transporting P-type ATPase N-terminal domain-containing protein n=1 Tax=Minwuia thermotolerans TaxID=2056226 RepID=A0A2M9G3B5_9PROT|nr:cation-transporting P-type ATPase [Minwuia thermotolerans]PJK30198.1 hypothetical protein CVT23_07295 [Minwuia thermotolerans]